MSFRERNHKSWFLFGKRVSASTNLCPTDTREWSKLDFVQLQKT
ncbi:unnamed protein product [Arabidopsis thaliana]|uniref:Uncharacterized protein n=4 Tax=Arabidopsis TaxID=3701 RepID=A0A654FYA0_ARATH|nr:uncharacterized protein AT5G04267 [Arabidopsis thaliana]KAG7601123.1 hypothetical protein ISN45_At05g003390 [Arabidopsis thaliana x Arabidopsis arenosa]KAG7608067.1 hypothetical protein ISN44_As05g003440 [Arabidopsis suecica]AED90721.1 hypothetical protein AT5G04267 [Arabidopsis thaliana]CAA0400577.1 unnamed protein product [Arabidopsis thaliana]VYS65825.1 unnamed protein product [Arabidopsis thaliana]|eukprot:NP_001119169.1 hypothetical protein AT5G04267 [Arabidopsis thaliana]